MPFTEMPRHIRTSLVCRDQVLHSDKRIPVSKPSRRQCRRYITVHLKFNPGTHNVLPLNSSVWGTLSRGLAVFLEVAQNAHADKAHIMGIINGRHQSCFLSPLETSSFLSFHRRTVGTTYNTNTLVQTSDWPSKHDQLTIDKALLPFAGDDLAGSMKVDEAGEKTRKPPVAYTELCDGRYKNTYGADIDKGYRKWGFVFWDKSRLDKHVGTIKESMLSVLVAKQPGHSNHPLD